jgi:hypothetical protein
MLSSLWKEELVVKDPCERKYYDEAGKPTRAAIDMHDRHSVGDSWASELARLQRERDEAIAALQKCEAELKISQGIVEDVNNALENRENPNLWPDYMTQGQAIRWQREKYLEMCNCASERG